MRLGHSLKKEVKVNQIPTPSTVLMGLCNHYLATSRPNQPLGIFSYVVRGTVDFSSLGTGIRQKN